MSDKTIRVGDLVMVVKPTPCCGSHNNSGTVHKVLGIQRMKAICFKCGKVSVRKLAFMNGLDGEYVCRLFKINPPAKDTETEREKEAV